MKQDLIRELNRQLKNFKHSIARTQARLKEAPEGGLSISMQGKIPRFYHTLPNKITKKSIRRYLKQQDAHLVKLLAQKGYDQDALKAAIEQSNVIETFLTKYDADVLKELYYSLSSARKSMITEFEEIDDEEYARRWQQKPYTGKPFAPNDPEFYTIRGERVRSKSEKIIADLLYTLGIPYRYESPVKMRDGRVWYPDFVILNIATREEYILEHFGMMDDPEYCAKALGKISVYIQNGIFLGDKLLISFEAKGKPLSTKDLELMFRHFFL